MNKEMKKVLISGMVGNALEWYDFVLFVQFTPFIGKLFFPIEDDNASLLAALGVFAVGFIMRPIGGVLFGYIGDKFGRKFSIFFSILMMSIPTAFIGILPTYHEIGILAPIFLTIIRLFQGLALGGGFSGCMTFLVEHAPAKNRGLIGSASMFSLGAGVLLGIIVTTLISSFMDRSSFESWGWRLPFIASIAIGMVAFYIKNHVHESPVYLEAKKSGSLSKTPVREVLKFHTKTLFIAVGVYLTVTVPFYTLSAFFNTFLQKKMGVSLYDAMLVNGIAIVAFMIIIPFSGSLSDKIGRKTVLAYSALMMAIVAYPVFVLLSKGTLLDSLIAQIIFALVLGFYIGPAPAMLVELFPTNVRFSGLALSYNISAAMFGGTVPYIYFELINRTQSNIAPAFYIIIFAFLTLLSIYCHKDKQDHQDFATT